MYKDGNGLTYDAGLAKFTSTPFGKFLEDSQDTATAPTSAGGYYVPFNFTDAATFKTKADNSVAGEMRDCGECHVGGGLMEYMIDPAKTTVAAYDPTKRTSLRDYVFDGAVTAFNALIDIFNDTPALRGEVVVQDYAQTGVLEMDCLICHQKDYSWEKRKHEIRDGKFDASRAMGANMATSAKNGVTVFYNSTSVTRLTDGTAVANLEYKIVGKPLSEQCTSCHLGTAKEDANGVEIGHTKYQVDWKKRGELWSINGVKQDIHSTIGCMGCHERKSADLQGNPTAVGTGGTTSDTNLGLCDPAKGGASPFDALWNALDNKDFKDCAGCHEPATTPTYKTFGAPSSKGAHDKAGLTAKVAYGNAAGTVAKSHIELIDCTACHIRKEGFSGGAFVDGTGADEEGRVAIHDTEHVAKGDMVDGVALQWKGGKIYASNLLTSFFWRDVNGLSLANGGLDINNDERTGGMDPLLQTHVNNINLAQTTPLHGITHDGVVTATEINTQKAALSAGIRGQLGISTTQTTNPFLPKLSFLMVPFKASHNTASADKAWGAKGCKQCHSAKGTVIAANDADNKSGVAYTAGGFYNGAYPINGNMEGNFNFSLTQTAPYTKVNGMTDPTDSHPAVVTKDGNRSVPVKILSGYANPWTADTVTGTLRNIDRSEVLYETTFQTIKDTYSTVPIVGGAIPAACSTDGTSPFYCSTIGAKKGATATGGWYLKVDVAVDTDTTNTLVTSRTKEVESDIIANVDGFVTEFSTFGGVYFSVIGIDKATGLPAVSPAVNNALKIIPSAGYKIRINKGSDVGPFGLKGALWKDEKIVRGTTEFTGRGDYVTYLNSIDPATFGVNQAPVAAIAAVAGETGTAAAPLVKGTGYALAATATPAAGATVKWATNAGTAAVISDDTAAAPTVTFSKPGTFRVALTVTNVDGATATSYKLVNVKNPVLVTFAAPVTTSVVTPVDATLTKPAYSYTTVTTTVPVSIVAGVVYDKVRFFWGDGSASTTLSKGTSTDAEFLALVESQAHKYNRYTKYLIAGKYTYKTTVQLFNGTSLVNSQSVIVEVP